MYNVDNDFRFPWLGDEISFYFHGLYLHILKLKPIHYVCFIHKRVSLALCFLPY